MASFQLRVLDHSTLDNSQLGSSHREQTVTAVLLTSVVKLEPVSYSALSGGCLYHPSKCCAGNCQREWGRSEIPLSGFAPRLVWFTIAGVFLSFTRSAQVITGVRVST